MGEVTDILEFWGLFSTQQGIHFVRFYVMFYRLGLTLEGCFRCSATMRRVARSESRVAKGATPHRLRRSSPRGEPFIAQQIKNNLLYSSRDYGILTLYVLAKVH